MTFKEASCMSLVMLTYLKYILSVSKLLSSVFYLPIYSNASSIDKDKQTVKYVYLRPNKMVDVTKTMVSG